MKAKRRRLLAAARDSFFLVPAVCAVGGIVGAAALVSLDRSGAVSEGVIASPFVYSGGATGARTLLGAVASSTIGVAGTVFSITIAALSLAAGQMGPRLLRNFTSDRGNQVTLGIFLGTFCYALTVLRTVRAPDEGNFVPNVALSVGLLLAFACVGTLVYFVHHVAGRINVDTVIGLVSRDVHAAIARLTTAGEASPVPPPSPETWRRAVPVASRADGYLQELDTDALADWAAAHGTTIRLLARPGDYVFPGAPIALLAKAVEGAAEVIGDALAVGPDRVSTVDLEYSVRQLVEVGVRALSSGINDPHTAIGVLDRLGTALCGLVGRQLPDGVVCRAGAPVVVVPRVTYDGLSDAMFNMMRQDGAGTVSVVIRMLEVLTAVASCESSPDRLDTLQRHADLVLADSERAVASPADLEDIRGRHRRFSALRQAGVAALVAES